MMMDRAVYSVDSKPDDRGYSIVHTYVSTWSRHHDEMTDALAQWSSPSLEMTRVVYDRCMGSRMEIPMETGLRFSDWSPCFRSVHGISTMTGASVHERPSTTEPMHIFRV